MLQPELPREGTRNQQVIDGFLFLITQQKNISGDAENHAEQDNL